jgi:ABC-type transport system involved in cytochrome c biogenesis permease subunit
MVCAGLPLLTAGLLLGSVWGQQAWGDYWGWDPKELWSLVSWLLYVGYLHFRSLYGSRHARLNSLWVIAGILAVLITLIWVNLSRLFPGLHNYAM